MLELRIIYKEKIAYNNYMHLFQDMHGLCSGWQQMAETEKRTSTHLESLHICC